MSNIAIQIISLLKLGSIILNRLINNSNLFIMKQHTIYFALMLAIIFSCDSVKKPSAIPAELKDPKKVWTLNYVTGPKITFDGLFPNKKPRVTFNLDSNEISGFTSCNSFSSKIKINGNTISINSPLQTMMKCEGSGENTFINMLEKVDRYHIVDGKLEFLNNEIVMMRFE